MSSLPLNLTRGVITPRHAAEAHADALAAAEARARRRFKIASYADRTRAPLREIRASCRTMVHAGDLDGPIPSLAAISELRKAWRDGKRQLADYAERPRPGRPRRRLPERLLARLREELQSQKHVTTASLYRDLTQAAARWKLPSPSYRAVAREVKQQRLATGAAFFGARATEILAMPHATVPCRHTHDIWYLDETEWPVWLRRRDHALGRWVSFVAALVVITDACSRAVLSALLIDPQQRALRRGDPVKGPTFDSEDVLAAVLSAACRDLAREVTADLAGYLPKHAFRWDRAKPHERLRERLERVGVRVPKLPGNRPPNRGAVEVLIKTLKAEARGMHGHVDRHAPLDHGGQFTPDELRLRAAGHGGAEPRRRLVPVEGLMTVEDAQHALDEVVLHYNTESRPRRLNGRTPVELYHERKRSDARRGDDILHVLERSVGTVSDEGIVVERNGLVTRFAFGARNLMLMRGETVSYRADPWHRGIFVDLCRDTVFFEPMDRFAERLGERRMAAIQSGPPRAYSRQAAADGRAETAREAGGTDAAPPTPADETRGPDSERVAATTGDAVARPAADDPPAVRSEDDAAVDEARPADGDPLPRQRPPTSASRSMSSPTRESVAESHVHAPRGSQAQQQRPATFIAGNPRRRVQIDAARRSTNAEGAPADAASDSNIDVPGAPRTEDQA